MLHIVRAKACKRCGGNLSIECDIYGVYIQCIQCSATWNREDVAIVSSHNSSKIVKKVKAQPLAAVGK